MSNRYGSGSVTFAPRAAGAEGMIDGMPFSQWKAKTEHAQKLAGQSFDDVRRDSKRKQISREVEDKYAGGYKGLPKKDQNSLLAMGYQPQ